ncbi:MAG: FMN phosphatase YigB (HAD superfamily) [Flavobacteriales bacterium]|jgi:FMN phosphatase YigB (HAD superfamily)
MLKGVKNIIFDLGGVILNIDYQLTSIAFFNAGFQGFDTFYSQAKQSSLFDDFETGEISSEEFCAEIRRISGLSNEKIIECWNSMLLDLPIHRIDFLKSLKGRYRLFLLSNTNEIHLNSLRESIVEKYGSDILSDIFEVVYYSHELGLRKPNAGCFNAVLEANGLLAQKTLFIDDSIQHVNGAATAGVRSVLLQSNQDITSLFPDTIL